MFEEKYIKLLLHKCLSVEVEKPLFINYCSINKDFVDKLVKYANMIGIKDIYLHEIDKNKEREILKTSSIEEIKNNPLFINSIWDEYVKKDAAFLMLNCEIPGLMDDVEPEKLALISMLRRTTKPLYREKQQNGELAWCIAAIPNEIWARDLYPEEANPLNKFWDTFSKICMLDSDNPIETWDNFLKQQNLVVNKLNSLQIKKLYYKNSLGTNLEITLPKDALWQSAASNKWLVNIPSYEIFSTPNYKLTNGIVYSSMPLIYNGVTINDFYLKFENGKVVDYDAKEGKRLLKEILEFDELSAFLGEVALVNFNSPISNTKTIFKTTLFDENASCHLALGSGFLDCIKNGVLYTEEELDNLGINLSKNHVDFMIGTKDLQIDADTKDGRITIMKNGNLII